MKTLSFSYNDKGRGVLTLYNGRTIIKSCKCRTGSIDSSGSLVNAIKPGVWTVREPSVDTTESGMIGPAGIGWKTRMWTPEGEWSHYLIHPDGGKGGTKGCIGIQGDGFKMRELIDEALQSQEMVLVYVNTAMPYEPKDDVYENPKTGISINYSRLREMDVFMSSNMYPSGMVVRLVRAGIRRVFSMKVPAHGGFITKSNGQFFATEMALRGIVEVSLQKYTKKSNRIIRIWRWKRFDQDILRAKAQEHLSRLRRISLEYDPGALLAFTRVLKRIVPWVKNSHKKDFCTENVFLTLRRYGLRGYPPRWDKRAPAPDELDSWMRLNGDFVEISAVHS